MAAPLPTRLRARLRALARWPHLAPLALLALAALALFAPTLGVYMWYGHERFHPVSRVRDICLLWAAQGPFQTPWLPDVCFGQGWPFFTFYGPLSYWFAAACHFIFGLDYGAATRASFYASMLLSGGAMYALAWTVMRGRMTPSPSDPALSLAPHFNEGIPGIDQTSENRFNGFSQTNNQPSPILAAGGFIPRARWWALAAATIYFFAPYHLTEIFARGSLAEGWVWATLPALLWALEAGRERPARAVPWIALAGAALISTHTLFAMFSALFVAAYVLLTMRSWRWLAAAAAGGVLAALLSAFYWMPVMFLKQFVPAGDVGVMNGQPEMVSRHVLHWQQFFIERLGVGESLPGWRDQLGVNLGVAVGIAMLLALVALLRPGLARFERRRIAALLAVAAVLIFIMSTAMPWAKAPAFLRYVQFPWRFLLLTTLIGALALACAAPLAARWLHPLWLAGLAAAVGLVGAHATLFWDIPPMDDRKLLDFIAEEEKGLSFSGCQMAEYRPYWVRPYLLNYRYHEDFPPRPDRIMSASGPFQLGKFLRHGTAYYYTYAAPAEVRLVIQVFEFPGWELYVDEVRAPERLGRDRETGYVALRLPPGAHVAELRYELSPPGRVGRWISAAGWIILAGYVLILRRRGGRDKHAAELAEPAPAAQLTPTA